MIKSKIILSILLIFFIVDIIHADIVYAGESCTQWDALISAASSSLQTAKNMQEQLEKEAANANATAKKKKQRAGKLSRMVAKLEANARTQQKKANKAINEYEKAENDVVSAKIQYDLDVLGFHQLMDQLRSASNPSDKKKIQSEINEFQKVINKHLIQLKSAKLKAKYLSEKAKEEQKYADDLKDEAKKTKKKADAAAKDAKEAAAKAEDIAESAITAGIIVKAAQAVLDSVKAVCRVCGCC